MFHSEKGERGFTSMSYTAKPLIPYWSSLELALRQFRERNTLVCVKIKWRLRFLYAAASEVEFWIFLWSQVGLWKKINLPLRGSNLVGCQMMARVFKTESVRYAKGLVHWKNYLLFQQRVVRVSAMLLLLERANKDLETKKL